MPALILPRRLGRFRQTAITSTNPSLAVLFVRFARLASAFFPYEFLAPIDNTKPLAGQIEKREIGQASNLEKLINAARPEDKLLIHVGYSHLEKSENGPIKMMAAHFLEDTGLNPLTVSQTNYWSPTGRYEICDPAALHVTDPSTLFVGAPKPAFFRGRPSWRIAAAIILSRHRRYFAAPRIR